ncbi:polysaccharide pyruvyl transferase family protein [Enterococcus sp. C76]|uniref:polysaccharide pyruvyl transferase family protein n=1 Tax=Enterococcus sp. C76 TaxID=3231334 RepID=UPI0034A0806B
MLRVGIITLNGEFNYGNRLQNFALQKVLQGFGVTADTIVIKTSKFDKLKKEFCFGGEIKNIRDVNYILKKNASKITLSSFKRRKNYKKMKKLKYETIRLFTESNIRTIYTTKKELEDLKRDYNLFIVGSDQVWNPNIIEFDTTHFLSFVSREKRFSYAASIGVENMPEYPIYLREHYKKNLSNMNYISVREQSGSVLLEKMLGKKIDVAPDPTLLLNKEEWCQKLNIVDEGKDSFLLIYFVSEISPEIYKEIKKIAKEKQLSIIHVMGDTFGEGRITPNPSKFVELIYRAQYVFTDSFHGSVFSIIMNTPFFVYKRTDNKGTYTRIESLLSHFKMEQAIVSLGDNIKEKEDLFNFAISTEILKKERVRGRKLIFDNILNDECNKDK